MVVVLIGLAAGGRLWFGRLVVADSETATVTRGVYTDIVEIRGQVQPVRSTLVTAPFNAGELQILKMASNGTNGQKRRRRGRVRRGDAAAHDPGEAVRAEDRESRARRKARRNRGSRSRNGGLRSKKASSRSSRQGCRLARSVSSRRSWPRARSSPLADAEQRLREAEASFVSAKANAAADRQTRERRIEKVEAELALAQTRVTALHVKAPVDGTVSILPNYPGVHADGQFGAGIPDRRPRLARRDDPGASGSVVSFLTARIDEADRGQLAADQPATIRVDAIADRDYQATVSRDLSPRAHRFHQRLAAAEAVRPRDAPSRIPDTRLRPGMSAAARITVGRFRTCCSSRRPASSTRMARP